MTHGTRWDEKVAIWDEKVTRWDDMERKWDEMGRKWDGKVTRWDEKKRNGFLPSLVLDILKSAKNSPAG